MEVNALGQACPIPVVRTKKAISSLKTAGTVTTFVDNEIAVQNLKKLADRNGYTVTSEKISDSEYHVSMTIREADLKKLHEARTEDTASPVFVRSGKKNTVVVIDKEVMGFGDDQLGRNLLKGFIFALCSQDELPETMLFYNGGAHLTTEGSASLTDLQALEASGVKIYTCGTCLNFYGIADKLKVGEITNMYDITEIMTHADLIVRP